MIHRIYSEWRKVFVLSATFLVALFLIVACKKRETNLGSSGIDAAGLLAAGAIDTFTLETYSILDDSMDTKNQNVNVLGEFNDPVFGKIKTSFYTQVLLESDAPNFGDPADIIMDSMILAMKFDNYTGNIQAQTFEVYELDESISKDASVRYYDTSSLNVKPTNLMMPGQGTVKPDPIADAVIDTVKVSPQMRLKLDTNFAKNLINEAWINPTSFSTNDNFLTYFKGLYVTTNNPTQAPGQGGIFGFNMLDTASKVTIYYQRKVIVSGVPTWQKKTFDLEVNSKCQSFNRAEIDRSGTKVEHALTNTSSGLSEFYTQAFGLRAVVNIPGLSNIPKNSVIHKAILSLPIQYQTGSIYSPGVYVKLIRKLIATSNQGFELSPTNGTLVNNSAKSVNQDISGFVQNVVSGSVINTPIYVLPFRGLTSGDRIIFNGPNTLNKVKPKLYIIYSEF